MLWLVLPILPAEPEEDVHHWPRRTAEDLVGHRTVPNILESHLVGSVGAWDGIRFVDEAGQPEFGEAVANSLSPLHEIVFVLELHDCGDWLPRVVEVIVGWSAVEDQVGRILLIELVKVNHFDRSAAKEEEAAKREGRADRWRNSCCC